MKDKTQVGFWQRGIHTEQEMYTFLRNQEGYVYGTGSTLENEPYTAIKFWVDKEEESES